MRIRPWGQVHRLAISSLLGWALLLGLVTLLLSADAATLPALAQALPRAITRTLTAADFRLGTLQGLTMTTAGDGALRLAPDAPGHRGTYIAAPTSFDLPLTALAVRLDADIPRDTQLTIELRTGPDGQSWSSWAPLYTLEPDHDGRLGAENLVVAAVGDRWAQARVRFTGTASTSPVLRALDLIAIDASRGPSAAQSRAMAQTRQSRSGMTASTAPAKVSQPKIISRAEWGANEDWMTWPPEYSPVQKIIIHHTVTGNDDTDPAAMVRAIYYYHAVVRGWGDIAYNYLVDRYGNIYEGRAGGPNVIGGHTVSYNIGSVGIGALGTFGNTAGSVNPSSDLVSGIVALSAWEAARSGIDPLGQSFFVDTTTYNIAGHRDYDQTSCPGDYLYEDLDPIRQATWQRMQQATGPELRAEFRKHTTPTALTPRQTVSVKVTVRNTGSLTWPAGGDQPVHLGYHWVDQNGQVVRQKSADDHRTALPHDVAPSEKVTLDTLLTAPSKPGTYTLKWDMVQENVSWFGDQGSPPLAVNVSVIAPPTAHSLYLPLIRAGQGGASQPPPTPEPGPTPTPQPNPPPTAGCGELLVNGNFESQDGWTINLTDRLAVYTNLRRHAGRWSMRTGVPPGGWNMDSYSSFEQSVTIPADATNATLRFWWLLLTDDPVNDSQYVFVQDASGTWNPLLMEHSNAGTWQPAELDLSGYVGQTITIRFGSYNNGRGGVTSLWIDDASLMVCSSH